MVWTRRLVRATWWRAHTLSAGVFLGAASLIGFEALALLVGFSTAWPVAIPLVVAALALIYWLRRLLFRRPYPSEPDLPPCRQGTTGARRRR
ncbi:hypothetical protein GCM10027515_33400 [Schumannella luteola]